MGDLQHEHGRQWEACLFYPQEDHEFISRIPDVLYANRTGNNLHPTEKPVDLISRIIGANVGDTILDPFLGSGTTAVACKQLGRNYIGIELSQKYVDIANERLKQDLLF
jgi:site-specific DNA-methyltransferase (adenine-specific)